MFFGDLRCQSWQAVRFWQAEASGLSRNATAVLTTAGSLTRFLERHFGIKLDVRLHDQFVDMAHAEESGLLSCPEGAPALRRQVSLLHRGAVMFDAESVLPLDALPAELISDLEEGKRPLGNLLLDRGLSLSRSDLSVTQMQLEGDRNGRWARRSVLRSPSGTRALVVEIFHPIIWERVNAASRHY